MSGGSQYDPDAAARPSDIFYTALLAQRDASLRVPINYVTSPGVTLTSACFSDNHYEDGPAQKCFSNLLATGFRRFVIDLYWDTSRLSWSLCPVELASGGAVAVPSASRSAVTSLSTSSSSTSAAATLTEAALLSTDSRRRGSAVAVHLDDEVYTAISWLQPRQTDDSSTAMIGSNTLPQSSISYTGLTTTASDTATSTSSNNDPTPLPDSGGTLYHIGPYFCDSSLGLSNITNTLENHLYETENSLNATLKFVIFNLHAAAPFSDPTGIAPTPTGALLPDTGNYVGQLINSSLSAYIFTPLALKVQRADLNTSWFTVDYSYRPVTDYLDIETLDTGILSSSGGWPSESYIELQKAMRFLAGFGTIDSQLQGYNFSADADTLFAPGYITDSANVTLSSTGVITNGCIFQPNDTVLSTVNSSWAVSSNMGDVSNFDVTAWTAGNMTSCGISPILNTSLGITADKNITLYTEYIQRDLWSWAYGEPREMNSSSGEYVHCAAFNYTNGGKWQVADCSEKHYAACRIGDAPYDFTITDQSGSYEKMDGACNDYDFTVPATAMENNYLHSAVASWLTTHDDDDGSRLFWLNFNDLDTPSCWVKGVNASCPYVEAGISPTRTIVVPVVAAIIIFVLFFLTVFIKCAANRQNSKRRRRRGVGGWDYEGVPS